MREVIYGLGRNFEPAAEQYFGSILARYYPKLSLKPQGAPRNSLEPDIVIGGSDSTVLMEVKAADAVGMLPPSEYAALKEQVQAYPKLFRRPNRGCLVTNFQIPPAMESHLAEELGVDVFRFALDERAAAVEERLLAYLRRTGAVG